MSPTLQGEPIGNLAAIIFISCLKTKVPELLISTECMDIECYSLTSVNSFSNNIVWFFFNETILFGCWAHNWKFGVESITECMVFGVTF